MPFSPLTFYPIVDNRLSRSCSAPVKRSSRAFTEFVSPSMAASTRSMRLYHQRRDGYSRRRTRRTYAGHNGHQDIAIHSSSPP